MAGSPPRVTSLVSLSAKSSADAWPHLGPAIGTGDGPQRHQGIDVSTCPVHPAPLESRLDHDLVGAFGAATADRIAGRLKGGVVDLCQAFGEVRHRSIPSLNCSTWISGELDRQPTERDEHLAHTVGRVFERV